MRKQILFLTATAAVSVGSAWPAPARGAEPYAAHEADELPKIEAAAPTAPASAWKAGRACGELMRKEMEALELGAPERFVGVRVESSRSSDEYLKKLERAGRRANASKGDEKSEESAGAAASDQDSAAKQAKALADEFGWDATKQMMVDRAGGFDRTVTFENAGRALEVHYKNGDAIGYRERRDGTSTAGVLDPDCRVSHAVKISADGIATDATPVACADLSKSARAPASAALAETCAQFAPLWSVPSSR